ncbi:hypothetical protein R1sor_012126 [Riccia sorocarpa]|uniref:Uncharacterized protein n=1 Tax=Riccia sorocarpa TaxID=122646 RepID=A0ABD3I6I1_9MARC
MATRSLVMDFTFIQWDECGKDILLDPEEEKNWDFFWKTANQDFDLECSADPDFSFLVGKKFKFWDGNHRVTVWLEKYATIVNPNLGPEFLATVRDLQVTLSKQENGKRDVKVEVGVDRIKAFAGAPLSPDLKLKLLKVHYNGDLALRSRYHHLQGNDLDDIRPWLNHWEMWSMLERYALSMLAACVGLQPGENRRKRLSRRKKSSSSMLKNIKENSGIRSGIHQSGTS